MKFLSDRQFIQWQLMPDEALNSYWSDFLKQHPEQEKEMQRAIVYLKRHGINKSDLSDAERTGLLKKIQKTIARKKRKLLWYSSGAAVILLLIGFSLLHSPEEHTDLPDKELIVGELLSSQDIQLITSEESISFQNDVEVTLNKEGTAEIIQSNNESSTIQIARDKFNSLIVPYGKRTTLTLADGSKVWLNSGSVLEFPAQFGGKNREIRLTSGEMYIEVAPDDEKAFRVQTAHFSVQVYGTKFNISTYSGSPQSVVLVEGSVGLQSKGRKELFISPSEKAVYSENGAFDTQIVDVAQYISWKDGYLSFDKTPMTEVLRQIGRYYNLSFDFENDVNLQKRTCTGKIYLSDNLDNVMTTVALLSSTKYEKQEKKIYITNKTDLPMKKDPI
jgi:ferric-dicitrate binding protein FerR (iron transport regulator)